MPREPDGLVTLRSTRPMSCSIVRRISGIWTTSNSRCAVMQPGRCRMEVNLRTKKRAAYHLPRRQLCGKDQAMSWQEVLRGRLVERNTRESAYAGIIEQCEHHQTRRETTPLTTSVDRRLAQQTRLLKTRNQTLLRATNVATTRSNPNASTVLVNEE